MGWHCTNSLMDWHCTKCDYSFHLAIEPDGSKERFQAIKKIFIDVHIPYCLLYQGQEIDIVSGTANSKR